MPRRLPNLHCCILLLAGPLAAQSLISRDGPLPMAGCSVDPDRHRLVVLGDQHDLFESDGKQWLRRPVTTSDFEFGNLAFHGATHQVLGFGVDAAGAATTVRWDGAVWQRLSPATMPSARHRTAMAYDAQRSRVVMFGGVQYQNATVPLLDETWEWDGVNWQLRPSPVAPQARYSATAAYDAVRGVVVLFGGQTWQAGAVDDTWEWDGIAWQQRQLAVHPPGLSSGAMAFDATRGRTVLFGNAAASGPSTSALWEYDGATWSQVPVASPWPPARSNPLLHAETGGEVVLTGGFLIGSGYVRDAWSWDGSRWAQRPAMPAVPRGVPSMQSFSIATEPQTGGVLLFGGGSASFPSSWANDTWLWNGFAWSRVATSGPPARALAAAWTHGNQVCLFGGQSPTSSTTWWNDTWVWNGSAWNAVATAHAPSPRRDTAVTYDAARGVAVLFSGTGTTSITNDTWTFDGVDWQQQFPAHSPQARDHHAMAYDPARGRVVLFGGAGYVPGTSGILGDTWEWDGLDWTQIQTATSPPASYSVAMAFDPQQQCMVLSQPTPQLRLDLWTYDGLDWTHVQQAAPLRLAAIPRLAGWPAARGVRLFDGMHLHELRTDPAAATAFGTSCGGGPTLTGRTFPRLGDALFGIDIAAAPANAPMLLVGATATANLPVGPCTLLVAPGQASVFAMADQAGFRTVDMPLPADPAFVGVDLFLQVAALHAPAPGGFVLSRGLQLHLGD